MRAHGRSGAQACAALASVVLAGAAACTGTDGPAPTPSPTANSPAGAGSSTPLGAVTEIAKDLDVPWDVAFLPDKSALVTLRDRAEVLRIAPGGAPQSLGTVPGVEPNGEGGLLGVAPSPDFATDSTVFLYFTAEDDNRIVSARIDGSRLTVTRPIFTGIRNAGHHDGGRIAFGPDGFLYVGTGDAGDTTQAQDPKALGGKILRIDREGKPAPGNPTAGSPVWSLGHRNVQGLAWDPSGNMYASEFGQNTWDELNLIVPGGNYGWPLVEGIGDDQRFRNPMRQWSTADASPSGIAWAGGSIYMAALRGQSLWRIPVSGDQSGEPKRLLEDRYGRLRHVALAPDGRLWVVTSNTFRGDARPGDDRILSIDPHALR